MSRSPEIKKWNNSYLLDERDATVGKCGLAMSKKEWLGFNWKVARGRIDFSGLLEKDPPLRVLEFGCGSNGTYIIPCAQHNFITFGVDISRVALRKLSNRGFKRKLNINLCLADVTQPLPFKDCSFDGIFSSGTIPHIDFNRRVLGELLRITKSGGVIQLSSFQNKSHPEHFLYYIVNILKLRFYKRMIFHRFHTRKGIDSFSTLKSIKGMIVSPQYGFHPFYSSFNYGAKTENFFKIIQSLFFKRVPSSWTIQIEKTK